MIWEPNPAAETKNKNELPVHYIERKNHRFVLGVYITMQYIFTVFYIQLKVGNLYYVPQIISNIFFNGK